MPDTSADLRLLDDDCDDYLLALLASGSAAIYQHKPTPCQRRTVARQIMRMRHSEARLRASQRNTASRIIGAYMREPIRYACQRILRDAYAMLALRGSSPSL